MNGAESLVHSFLGAGVDVCFSNPGTSEMHFVAALDDHPQMRCILCLFEGGVSGAAELRVLKNRAGARGYVDLYFDARFGRFEDVAE
jgi:replicative DNA helicase